MNKITPPLKIHMQGEPVGNLIDGLLRLLDADSIQLSLAHRQELKKRLSLERTQRLFGEGTEEIVRILQKQGGLTTINGAIDDPTAEMLNRFLARIGAFDNEPDRPTEGVLHEVRGRVFGQPGLGVDNLRVVIVDKRVGDDVILIETRTDTEGGYVATFGDATLRKNGKQQADLQTRVFVGDRLVGASVVRYNASRRETLHVRLDDGALPALRSEHESLTKTLAPHVAGKLGSLREEGEQQDITYLANKTGWDARAVAMAALAEQFSARAGGETAIPPAFFYALFRAGVPANETFLYQASVKNVEGIWQQAGKQGILSAADLKQIPQMASRFEQIAAQRALDAPALGGISSLKELLTLSLGNAPQHHAKFVAIQSEHRGDSAAFWKAVRQDLGPEAERRLRLDGQLGFLTRNNAQLIRKLHSSAGNGGLKDSRELVAKGLYRAETWEKAIGPDPVPDDIAGADATEKRAHYAELLAAQVQLSYPTAVVADLVRRGEVKIKADGPATAAQLADDVNRFLVQHQDKFEIGVQPIARYLRKNEITLAPEITHAITRIQRVYQLTPDNQSMTVLLARDFDSSVAITRFTREEFVEATKADLGPAKAETIHARARQINNVVLNLAVSYISAGVAPGIGARSDPGVLDPTPLGLANPNADDVIAYATLEQLFGEMDFCCCDHCRSILSPAAYLVDLLHFCDRPPDVIPPDKQNPLAVLLRRRPELEHLPLSCENTLIPLPYIDLINETLEFYITNGLRPDGYTGHSFTTETAREELLATPQFVNDDAFKVLAGQPIAAVPSPVLPPTDGLPFHQPLENLRRYFNRFEAPLPDVMAALRAGENLERAGAATDPGYGWRDILMEELRVSRPEYARLVGEGPALEQCYGFPAGTAEGAMLAALSNARDFCHRMTITYDEVVALLKTRFLNPRSALVPKFGRLGVGFGFLKSFVDGTDGIDDAAFDAAIMPGIDPVPYGGNVKTWVKDNFIAFLNVITLRNTSNEEDLCSFENLEFRFLNPDIGASSLNRFDFERFYRFIRLWKKLGWTIEQTDQALSSLWSGDPAAIANAVQLNTGFRTVLPRLGVVHRMMRLLQLQPRKDLASVLACFADIGTHGEGALYREMFLSPALLQLDPAFGDHGTGVFLQDNSIHLLDHREALRAAFVLTDDEFSAIVAMLRFDANTPLTLPNVSAVYKRGWLARKLRLSVRELLTMMDCTRIDPFFAPDPYLPPTPIYPPILRFIELVMRLREAGLRPQQALYLLWHRDLTGKATPSEQEVREFLRISRTTLRAIEGEFAVSADPDGQIARGKMASVYGAETTELFFGLLDNTFVTSITYNHGSATVSDTILTAADQRLGYDNLAKQLTFRGLLSLDVRNAIQGAGGGAPFNTAVGILFDENRKIVEPFFDRYRDLRPLFDAYVTSNAPAEQKRSALLAQFLPDFRRRRMQQAALQTIAAAGSNEALATAILDAPNLFHALASYELYLELPAPGALPPATDLPALDDLLAAQQGGLSVQFFLRDDLPAGPLPTPDEVHDFTPALAYAAGSARTLPAGPPSAGTICGIWAGYLEAPSNGFFNLRIEANAAAVATVSLDAKPIPLVHNLDNSWTNQEPILLRAGNLYPFALQVTHLRDTLSARWETAGQGLELIPARFLYPAVLADHLRTVYLRFLKINALATALKLTSSEIAYLAARVPHRIAGEAWLNRLPVTASVLDDVTLDKLLQILEGFLDFALLKRNLSPVDNRLLTVLQDPNAIEDGSSLLLNLTRWEDASLTALLSRFARPRTDMTDPAIFRRVWEAFGWVTKLRISGDALLRAATNEPTAVTVRDLQSALRARFSASDWLGVLKPINDSMRGLQRDALVAYILHSLRSDPATAHIDTPEKLFEFFLMDVEMEPCMLTSRVRHALSCVQLFIERCLMNLETHVDPRSLDGAQWSWMSRYRIWEANRKVFLYPENWLEPELRDDQSPFFKETMSELLQGDITEERAAVALLDYLSKLEEVAKLEPCGIHYEERELDKREDDIAHVVARTAGANRKYYYRRLQGSWTPWEHIKLDIEDNPIIPVIWQDRLFLFWLRIVQDAATEPSMLQQAPTAARDTDDVSTLSMNEVRGSSGGSAATLTKVKVGAVLCWSEYYNGKWQPIKTSDVSRPSNLGSYNSTGSARFDRSSIGLQSSITRQLGRDDVLILYVTNARESASFTLRNTHSAPIPGSQSLSPDPGAEDRVVAPNLVAAYSAPGLDPALPNMLFGFLFRHLLRPVDSHGEIRTVDPGHPLQREWVAPFFYEDPNHVFYVTTELYPVRFRTWEDAYPTLIINIPTAIAIAPIMVAREQERWAEDARDPRRKGPAPRPTDDKRLAVKLAVSEDSYITRVIGSTQPVPYGTQVIDYFGRSNGIQR